MHRIIIPSDMTVVHLPTSPCSTEHIVGVQYELADCWDFAE